jgi:oligopeptide transport system substrate-binding protein
MALCALLLLGAAAPLRAEGVLRRGNGADPATLDPHLAVGLPEAQILYDLFEGLVARGADGRPVPALATRWEASPDGLSWRFTLRDGARWSDGSPVTADDVVFSFRRLVDPATASPNAQHLRVIAGAREIAAGRQPDLSRLGVRAVEDGRAVEIALVRPFPQLPDLLSFPMLAVVSAANVRQFGRDFARPGRLLSNGAYTLAEAVPQDHVKLVRNPLYWNDAATRIDSVYFYPTQDQEAELQRFRAGELDVTATVPPSRIGWARTALAASLHSSRLFGTYAYVPNLTREPWRSSPALRAALDLAIDRDLLTRKVTQGGEAPSFSIVPPLVTGYRPAAPAWAGWTQVRRDEEARRLLAEAGHPGGRGLTVELLVNSAESHRRVAVAVAAMWKRALGLDVVLTDKEFRVFLGDLQGKSYPGLARYGYIGPYDDAAVFLDVLRRDAGPLNPSGYDNPAFDALLDRAAGTADPAARNDLLRQAEGVALADHAVLPIYTYALLRLVAPRVAGFVDNPLDAHPTRTLSLTEETR